MQGQIIARGRDRWLVRIPLGRGPEGTRRYHNHTVRGSRKDAEKYRTKILREMDTGTFVEASPQLLQEYLEEWLNTSVAPRVRPRVLADYAALARRHIVPALGHRKLSEIFPPEIQRLYAAMQAKGLSPRTVRYVHSVLHSSLEQAVRFRLLARNPSNLVDLPRMERREMRSLSQEEAQRFLAAASGSRWQALWNLLLMTGLRPGEALGLKWSDLDGDRLRIQRRLVHNSGASWDLSEPKTPRARRVVILPASALRSLQVHRSRQAEERLKAGPDYASLDLVFASRTGQPLEWRVVSRRHFKSLVAKAGLTSDLRPYDLRHTHATLLLAAGENVKVVSERLGHASASLTLDVYSHVLPDMQQRAAERMDQILVTAAAGT